MPGHHRDGTDWNFGASRTCGQGVLRWPQPVRRERPIRPTKDAEDPRLRGFLNTLQRLMAYNGEYAFCPIPTAGGRLTNKQKLHYVRDVVQ